MIYELNIYTLKTGAAPIVVSGAGTIERQIRGDDYGKLEGFWTTEIGQLNQVVHLWSYADFNECGRLRGELSRNQYWASEYAPLLNKYLVHRTVRLLNCVIAPNGPTNEGNIYEFRNYRCRPDGLEKWVSLFLKFRSVRERYSKIVAMFTTEASLPDEVCHIWVYPHLNALVEGRRNAVKDPEWQAFLSESVQLGLTEEMYSTIMFPANHSPLK